MIFPFAVVSAIIDGVLAPDNRTKQELGWRVAFLLCFEPGPRGADDGIDGLIVKQGKKIHFQSKVGMPAHMAEKKV